MRVCGPLLCVSSTDRRASNLPTNRLRGAGRPAARATGNEVGIMYLCAAPHGSPHTPICRSALRLRRPKTLMISLHG